MGVRYEGCEPAVVERALNITTAADYLCLFQTQNFQSSQNLRVVVLFF